MTTDPSSQLVLPKKFKCPNRSFHHTSDVTIIEQVWKDKSKQGIPPYLKQVIPIDDPRIAITSRAIILCYDICAECGTYFCRQIVEAMGTAQTVPMPNTGQRK